MSRPTCRMLSTTAGISDTGLSPTMAEVSNSFSYPDNYHIQAPPRSLATTCGISVEVSSSSYLDVSVQTVPFLHLFDSMQDDWILSSRVAPFGDLRVKGYLLLTAAYRSLSRPSSAPDAKAFPLRSF